MICCGVCGVMRFLIVFTHYVVVVVCITCLSFAAKKACCLFCVLSVANLPFFGGGCLFVVSRHMFVLIFLFGVD